jgi:CheY-like chemotaxis protein
VSHTIYRRRVLVADADPERAATLRALLHVWGHNVAGAADAPSALRRAESFRPDVVVAGPGLHGIAKPLRQSPARDGVLMVAVTDGDVEPAAFQWFGAALSVPLDPERLRALVATGTVQAIGAC